MIEWLCLGKDAGDGLCLGVGRGEAYGKGLMEWLWFGRRDAGEITMGTRTDGGARRDIV